MINGKYKHTDLELTPKEKFENMIESMIYDLNIRNYSDDYLKVKMKEIFGLDNDIMLQLLKNTDIQTILSNPKKLLIGKGIVSDAPADNYKVRCLIENFADTARLVLKIR